MDDGRYETLHETPQPMALVTAEQAAAGGRRASALSLSTSHATVSSATAAVAAATRGRGRAGVAAEWDDDGRRVRGSNTYNRQPHVGGKSHGSDDDRRTNTPAAGVNEQGKMAATAVSSNERQPPQGSDGDGAGRCCPNCSGGGDSGDVSSDVSVRRRGKDGRSRSVERLVRSTAAAVLAAVTSTVTKRSPQLGAVSSDVERGEGWQRESRLPGGGVGGSVDARGTEKSVDVIPLRDKCNTDRSAASEASSFVPTRRPRKTQDARGETGEATEGISSSEDGAECFRDPERSPRPRRNSWELHQIAGNMHTSRTCGVKCTRR